jgi:hypothetical protein
LEEEAMWLPEVNLLRVLFRFFNVVNFFSISSLVVVGKKKPKKNEVVVPGWYLHTKEEIPYSLLGFVDARFKRREID